MSTAIEWTDETWNPVTGCTKVSPGCDNCYAERVTNRFRPGSFDTVVLHPQRLDKPLHWRKPRRVFVNSMSDLFHEEVPSDFIAECFAVMAAASQHTFQVLTKRPGRMASLLRSERFFSTVNRHYTCLDSDIPAIRGYLWPLPNVWLGVSAEDQRWADIRIPQLRQTPAAIRFLSCEPLLGPVSLRATSNAWGGYFIDDIDWVIVGGESGPNARAMDPWWVRKLREECNDHDVPFFFKQWGGRTPKAGGAVLDGREWREMPQSLLGAAS